MERNYWFLEYIGNLVGLECAKDSPASTPNLLWRPSTVIIDKGLL